MSQIEHFGYGDVYIVPIEGGEFPSRGSIKPGDLVRHLNRPGNLGMIIMRAGDEISVLWSSPPPPFISVNMADVMNQFAEQANKALQPMIDMGINLQKSFEGLAKALQQIVEAEGDILPRT